MNDPDDTTVFIVKIGFQVLGTEMQAPVRILITRLPPHKAENFAKVHTTVSRRHYVADIYYTTQAPEPSVFKYQYTYT